MMRRFKGTLPLQGPDARMEFQTLEKGVRGLLLIMTHMEHALGKGLEYLLKRI